jgi:hypothetical protein
VGKNLRGLSGGTLQAAARFPSSSVNILWVLIEGLASPWCESLVKITDGLHNKESRPGWRGGFEEVGVSPKTHQLGGGRSRKRCNGKRTRLSRCVHTAPLTANIANPFAQVERSLAPQVIFFSQPPS